MPGLADEPAWPTLRARLLLLGASGIDPIAQLLSVVDTRELDSAVDRAAVVGWRLDDTGYPGFGPLPWLPAIPPRLKEHERWGGYLAARAATVGELADRVRASVRCSAADRRGLGRVEGSPQPRWSQTSRSGGPRWASVQTTDAPPVPFSDTRRPGCGSAGSTRRSPAASRPPGGSGDRWSTARTRRKRRTVSHPFWPGGWPQSQLLGSTPNSSCAPQPTASRCLMITLQRHCGGGSAATSTPPS